MEPVYNPFAFARTSQPGVHAGQEGMTLMDYFAGQALMGLCSKYGISQIKDVTELSKQAYTIAAAMLNQRRRSADGQ